MRQSPLQAAIAIFFVLFTFADIMSSEMCGEELQGFPIAINASINSKHSHIDEDYADLKICCNNSHPEDSSQPGHVDEDCFCCCSHLLPGKNFFVSVFEIVQEINDIDTVSLPISPPRSTFHPPRSA